jgi:uncharacterized peroxidase-related enzyme
MAHIRTIAYDEATGRLLEIYDELIKKRGKIAEVHKIQSLRPESIVKHMDLYLEIMFSQSELSRAEREMMAVVVSATNGCSYCKAHHQAAFRHYVKDELKITAIGDPTHYHELSEREAVLCHFARRLTLEPQIHENGDFTTELKLKGFSDQAILDATLVVAYFNFVNRMALALGVETNAEEAGGYKY